MPNEFAYSYLAGPQPISPVNLGFPGTVAAGTFRGRVLPIPIHHMTAVQRSESVRHLRRGDPSKYETLRGHALSGMSVPGLGSWAEGFAGVGGSILSGVASFAKMFASVVGEIVQVVGQILSFIADTVMAVVSSVMSAVGTLVSSVVDAITLKEDGDFDPKQAVDMGTYLFAKYQSLTGADKPQALNRNLTGEEKDGYKRQMKTAKDGIVARLSSGAGKLVKTLGGATNTLILGAAAAGAVFLMGR